MKKNVVRGFALVLVILMCLSLLPLAAARAEGHVCQFEPTEIPPTCGTSGYIQMICPVCGNGGEILQWIPPTGNHLFEAIVDENYLIEESDNLCEKPAVYWKSCINYIDDQGTVCGASAEEAYEQAVQNLYDQLNARKNSGEQADWETLVKDGIAAIDDRYKFNYGGLGHDWVDYPGQESTCEQDGWTAYRMCANCNEVAGYEVIPATGHRWNEPTVKEPTCTEPGSETRVCDICGKEETVELPANGHSWGEYTVKKEATCTENGEKVRVCTVCGEKETEIIPAAHKFGEYVVIEEPGCYSSGTQEHTCTVCGYKETETIPPAHKWSEYTVTQDPTCYSTGAEERECSVCGEKEIRWINTVPHSYENGECVFCHEPDPNPAPENDAEQTAENAGEAEQPAEDEQNAEGEQPVEGEQTAGRDVAVRQEASTAETVSDFVNTVSGQGVPAGDSAGMVVQNVTPLRDDGTRMSNEEVEARGGVTFEMPLPENYKDGDPIEVYHHNSETGEWELVPVTDFTIRDGKVIICVTHFSDFAVINRAETDSAATFESGDTVTVSLNANGGTGTAVSISGKKDDPYVLPSKADFPYTRSGYNFAGWNTAADGTGSSYGTVDNPYGATYTFHEGETVLYAQWALIVTVKFDPNGGTPETVNEKSGSLGGTITIPDISEYGVTRKLGDRTYNFTGWNLDQNGTAEDNPETHIDPGATAMLGGNATLYAEWVKPVTVKYMANGGSGYMKDDVTYYVGDKIKLAKNEYTYLRDGVYYQFAGWNTAADGSGIDYEDEEKNVYLFDDLTLYAQWGRPLTVSFYGNGADSGYMADQLIPAGFVKQLNKNEYKRTNFTFVGWNTAADGTGTSYEDEDIIYLTESAAQPYILYAQWKQTAFDIYFYTNDGATFIKEIKNVEDTITLPAYEDTDPGYDPAYVYIGWSLSKYSTEAAYKPGDGYKPTAETTFYAVRRNPVTVTFEFKDETFIDTQIVPKDVATPLKAFNDMATLPAGEYFLEWNTKKDGKGVSYQDMQSITLSTDKVLYAITAADEPYPKPTSDDVKATRVLVNYGDETLNGHPGTITVNAPHPMQWYNSSTGKWVDISSTSTTLTVRTPSSYLFRYAGDNAHTPSDSFEVVVKSYVAVATDPVGPTLDAATGKLRYDYDVTLYEVKKNGTRTVATEFPDEDVYFLLKYPDGISMESHFLTLIHYPDDPAKREEIDIEQLSDGILGYSSEFSPFKLLVDERLQGTVTLDNYVPKAGETITATVSDDNAPGKLAYRWLRDGTPITEAWSSSNKYTVTAADLMHTLTCEVKSATDYPLGTIKSLDTLQVDIEMVENTSYLESAYIGYFDGVVSGMQYRINGGAWVDVPGAGTPNGNKLYVKTPGTYQFRYKPETDSDYWAGPFELEGWYLVGYEISTSSTDSSGSGTVTLKNGTTTLSSSTVIKDSSGNVIIKAYDTHKWLVRIGAITNITMTVKPASSNYAHVSLNGGSYTSFNSERTFSVSPVNQHKFYTIVFNKSSTSPQTGDMSNLGLWSALCLVSFAGTVSILGGARRRRKEKL